MIANKEIAGDGARAYRLPELRYARYRIALRALGPARLPPFHGSTLRGAFGHALRKTVCRFEPETPCAPCILRSECPYPRIFETPTGPEPPGFLAGVATAPRPYVFEPRSEATALRAGEGLSFDLLLFGRAITLARYALAAIERMAATGLGASVGGQKARFALDAASWMPPDGGAGRRLSLDPGGTELEGDRVGSPLPKDALPGDGRSVRLRFSTPVRLLDRKRVVPPDRPRGLAFAILRRLLELAHFHQEGAAIDWTFKPLLEHAATLEADASDLRFLDVERYSQRQQAHTPLGGYVGSLILRGDLEPLAPLLRAGEVIHVGKGTVFGLGRYRIEAA